MTALLTFPVIHGAEASVTAGFSPGGSALDLILQLTGSARQSADVAAYDFTSRPVHRRCQRPLRGALRSGWSPMKRKAGTAGLLSASSRALAWTCALTACTASCTTSLLWPTAVRRKPAHLITRLLLKKEMRRTRW